MKSKNIFLWGHPRSLSTAMELYFRARGDFKVIHEPFADVYWRNENPSDVLNRIIDETSKSPIFIKDIAHHVPDSVLDNNCFITSFQHVVIFRPPLESFHSHLAVNEELQDSEFGYEALYKIALHIKHITGTLPIFLFSDNLQSSPETTIVDLVEQLEIEHLDNALSWSGEMHSDWAAGAEWQKIAGKSTSFIEKPSLNLPPLPQKYQKIYEHHNNFFNLLMDAFILQRESLSSRI